MTKLFLSGDVMTGRGIDQVLPHPSDPSLHESYVRDARRYVELAEQTNGPIRRSVDLQYIWGDALEVLEKRAPDARIINLETSVTSSAAYWPDKGINYRMHPDNVGCLTAAGVDCCVLANNHVLDFGFAGLEETLATLHGAGLRTAGAGRDAHEAAAPARIDTGGGGRVLVFAFGAATSGIPPEWRADGHAGIALLPQLSHRTASEAARRIETLRRPGDIVVVSVHWGGNWGYSIPAEQREFARTLIDMEAADVVHGHSSHHPKGIELHRGKPILYGCGDFLNDYEGIAGYEEYRPDFSLMYFVSFDGGSGEFLRLEVVPLRKKRLRLWAVSKADAKWLAATLERECARLGTRIVPMGDGTLTVA